MKKALLAALAALVLVLPAPAEVDSLSRLFSPGQGRPRPRRRRLPGEAGLTIVVPDKPTAGRAGPGRRHRRPGQFREPGRRSRPGPARIRVRRGAVHALPRPHRRQPGLGPRGPEGARAATPAARPEPRGGSSCSRRKAGRPSPASPAPTTPSSRPGGPSSCAGRISGRSGDARPGRPTNGSGKDLDAFLAAAGVKASQNRRPRGALRIPGRAARRRRPQGPVVRSGPDRRPRRRGPLRGRSRQARRPGRPWRSSRPTGARGTGPRSSPIPPAPP